MIARGVKEPLCSLWQITNALSSSEWCESLSVSVIAAVPEKRGRRAREGAGISWKTWEPAPEHEPSWGTLPISMLFVGILLRKCF